MARNLSVIQFQQLMARIPPGIADDMERAVSGQGSRLATAMAHNVAKGVDGRQELLESIRVEPGKHPLRKHVRAGGPLTTKKVREGFDGEYDYALANEFGTKEMAAQPFFWTTYRALKTSLRSNIRKAVRPALAQIVRIT